MVIGIDIRSLIEKRYTGVSEYTLNLILAILKLDGYNKYKFFYNSFSDFSDRVPSFYSENVEIIKTNYPNKIFNWIMQKFLCYPKIDKQLGVDVFLSTNVCPIALSSGCKKILVIYDLSFLRHKNVFTLYRRAWHAIANVKRLAKQADSIVTISESTKNDIIELCGINEKKITVCYPGVENSYRLIDRDDKNLLKIKHKYNLPEKFMFFLGTIEPRKNIESLIKAYNIFRDNDGDSNLKLVISGGMGWKYKNIFKEHNKSKYRDDIIFLGYVDSQDKTYLYNLALFFIYPSIYEGFGIPIVEAFRCGTPVITSFNSSTGEVASDAALLIDPYNINSISIAIKEMAEKIELRKYLSKKGFERAKKFSNKEPAYKVLDLFLN